MSIRITVTLDNSENGGQFTDEEQRVLDALGSLRVTGHVDASAEGFPVSGDVSQALKDTAQAPSPTEPAIPADQSTVLDAAAEKVVEKPKRTRRTKEQIAADNAAKESSTGAAVLSSDADPVDDSEGAEAERLAAEDAANTVAEMEAEKEANALEAARAAGYPGADEEQETFTPKEAFAKAQSLVNEQVGARKVKNALDKLGIEFVRHITTDEQATAFVKLVS